MWNTLNKWNCRITGKIYSLFILINVSGGSTNTLNVIELRWFYLYFLSFVLESQIYREVNELSKNQSHLKLKLNRMLLIWPLFFAQQVSMVLMIHRAVTWCTMYWFTPEIITMTGLTTTAALYKLQYCIKKGLEARPRYTLSPFVSGSSLVGFGLFIIWVAVCGLYQNMWVIKQKVLFNWHIQKLILSIDTKLHCLKLLWYIWCR